MFPPKHIHSYSVTRSAMSFLPCVIFLMKEKVVVYWSVLLLRSLEVLGFAVRYEPYRFIWQ